MTDFIGGYLPFQPYYDYQTYYVCVWGGGMVVEGKLKHTDN